MILSMIGNSLIQFEQFYRMMRDIITEYSDRSWNEYGHKLTRPPLLSYHILQSTKYYTNDINDFYREDGSKFSSEYKAKDEDKIKRNEIIMNIESQKTYLKEWIPNLRLSDKNEKYPWTGKDMESVLIFVIRHSYFHLGELSALLNESLSGDASDNFANNIY